MSSWILASGIWNLFFHVRKPAQQRLLIRCILFVNDFLLRSHIDRLEGEWQSLDGFVDLSLLHQIANLPDLGFHSSLERKSPRIANSVLSRGFDGRVEDWHRAGSG